MTTTITTTPPPYSPNAEARKLIERGWSPVPVPFKGKGPVTDKWQNTIIDTSNVDDYFNGRPLNVGVLLGTPSNNLTDVDCDCHESVTIAPLFLPKTDSVFGRAGKRRSHYLYYCTSLPKTTRFRDVRDRIIGNKKVRETLIEFRTTGVQTVFPPSVHETGEPIQWEANGEPADADGQYLHAITAKIAAASLLARYWPGEGSRHEAAMALSGGLIRAGWAVEDVREMVRAVALAARDEEVEDRVRAAESTAEALSTNRSATGWPRALELFGKDVVTQAQEWLGIEAGPEMFRNDHRVNESRTGTGAGDGTATAAESSPPRSPTPAYRPRVPDPLDEDAYHGVAGEIVRLIDPHTEADPVAVLIQTLGAFGIMAGRFAHFEADSARHGMNLNAVLMGDTSKGRKGTSWNNVRRVMSQVDEPWTKDHVLGGLSSGEGLIWAVRDPIYKREPIKKGKIVTDYQDVEIDPGVADKRLLVLEGEFANPLRQMKREGNVLSAVMRLAWDSGNLRTMTKNSPAVATEAHVGVFGHITRDELRREMDQTEAANGLGNRFLWLRVARSKVLPDGGQIDGVDFRDVVRHLQSAKQFAATVGRLQRDSAARDLWWDVYPALSEGREGMVGALTGRAEAQVMRLALIYAVLDLSPAIRADHLVAALALWRYCEQSVEYAFGKAIENPEERELRDLTDLIRQKWGGEATAGKVSSHRRYRGRGDELLGRMVREGLGEWVEPEPHKGAGRPAAKSFRLHPSMSEHDTVGSYISAPASSVFVVPPPPEVEAVFSDDYAAVERAAIQEDGA